jgi:hypothetical protein
MKEILNGTIIEISKGDGINKTPFVMIEKLGKIFKLEPENGERNEEYDYNYAPDFVITLERIITQNETQKEEK